MSKHTPGPWVNKVLYTKHQVLVTVQVVDADGAPLTRERELLLDPAGAQVRHGSLYSVADAIEASLEDALHPEDEAPAQVHHGKGR